MGVGNGGARSGVGDFRGRRTSAGALFIFLGDFFVGESGSIIVLCSAGCSVSSSNSDDSMLVLGNRLLPRVVGRGVGTTELVVRLLPAGAFRGLFLGAGVKSSSSSTSIFVVVKSPSSSESTITFLRLAALLEGRTGDSDIVRINEQWCESAI